MLCVGMLFTSCESDDDGTGNATLEVTPNVTGTITTDFDTSAVLDIKEADEGVYNYTVTLNEAQTIDIHLHVIQIDGDASSADYVAETLVIPAYSTSASGSISIVKDELPEYTETLTLQIGDHRTSNATIPVQTVSFTIENYLGPLEMTFDWDQEFSIWDEDFTVCEIGHDVDFIVYDDQGNDLGVVDAQTGSCPEELAMSLEDFGDGTYTITAYLYDDAGLATAPVAFYMPVTVTYRRAGSFGLYEPQTFEQTAFTSNSTSDTEVYIMTVTIAGDIFTISNDGVILASGRHTAINKAKKTAKKLLR